MRDCSTVVDLTPLEKSVGSVDATADFSLDRCESSGVSDDDTFEKGGKTVSGNGENVSVFKTFASRKIKHRPPMLTQYYSLMSGQIVSSKERKQDPSLISPKSSCGQQV